MTLNSKKPDPSLLLHAMMRQMRLKAKLRQVQLAQKLDKPQSYVSKIENGSRGISVVELSELCTACGVEITSFIRKWQKGLNDPEAWALIRQKR